MGAPYYARAACCQRPGCFRLVQAAGAGSGPGPCAAPVRWAGTVTFGDGAVWRAFACDGHHHGLDGPRPLTSDDHAYLEGLQRAWTRALAGKPYARPLPLQPAAPAAALAPQR